MTTYLGLRLQDFTSQANSGDGLWISIKNSSVGVRLGDWPNTEYIAIDRSFEQPQRVTVEDNLDKDEICIYVNNVGAAKEKRELVAQISIKNGQEITLFGATKAGAAVKGRLGHKLEKRGYVAWWNHLTPGITIDNIEISYQEYVREPYVAANPLAYVDTYSDTYVGFDALGRALPTFSDVGGPKDKAVGMFYFPWHVYDSPSEPIVDHLKAYQQAGVEGVYESIQQPAFSFGPSPILAITCPTTNG